MVSALKAQLRSNGFNSKFVSYSTSQTCVTSQSMTSPSQACSVSAARRVSRKYKLAKLHKMEYKKLQKVLPSVANSPKVSKVGHFYIYHSVIRRLK